MEPMARRFSNFAVVEHIGRSSGRTYRTPINLFRSEDGYLAALTYGPKADWVKKGLAAGGVGESAGTRLRISGARLVGRDTAWEHLPRLVRVVLTILRVHNFMVLELE